MLALSRAVPQKLVTPAVATTQLRQKSDWIYRLAPEPPVTNTTMGPWPRTKEEREKAAKKYNLIPEDYEPFPEEDGFGDYPNLPAVGAFNRYKYDDFDDPQDHRFYGEPFHLHSDLYHWERVDPMESQKISFKQNPWWKRITFCLGAPAILCATYYLMDYSKININHPWKIREYNKNRPVYAFPPSASDHGGHH